MTRPDASSISPARPESVSCGGRVFTARLRHCFWLKTFGTTTFMTVFFVAYFAVLRHPFRPVTEIPFTAPDHWIGFHGFALVPYVSLWLYVCLPSALMTSRRELVWHTWGAATLCLIGLGIFVVWPSSTPAAGIDWSRHPSILFLKAVDGAGNACPSLHAAFAVFACCWLGRVLRAMRLPRWVHALNVIWALAILYSTIATRQHVAIDTLAGAVLGWIVVRINLGSGSSLPPCSASR